MTESRQCMVRVRINSRVQLLLLNAKKVYSFFTALLNKCCKMYNQHALMKVTEALKIIKRYRRNLKLKISFLSMVKAFNLYE